MRLSKFTPSLCTVEGGVFGGMYFYHSVCYFLPMSNATFGSSFSLGNRFSPFRRKESAALHTPAARCRSRRSRGGGLGPGGGSGFGWSALLLLALLAWCCLLLACLPALRCAALLLGSFLLQRGTPFWFVLVPAEGNRFALGTGGIRWSLLVGGLGPVLSIPKLCFKPFRRFTRDPQPTVFPPAPSILPTCPFFRASPIGWLALAGKSHFSFVAVAVFTINDCFIPQAGQW